jgi:hypothetical protein
MIVFTTDKPLTKRPFFLSICLPVLIVLMLFGLTWGFFPGRASNASTALGVWILLIVSRVTWNEKVQEIRFDEEERAFHFYTKGYFTKMRKRKTSFDKLSVKKDIWESKRKWLPKWKTYSLEIFKEKNLVITVDMNEDHFSEEKLNAMIEAFESNNIPVRG